MQDVDIGKKTTPQFGGASEVAGNVLFLDLGGSKYLSFSNSLSYRYFCIGFCICIFHKR